ncbi:MAG: dihydrolipoamide acetyltransferase family protein [Candidatus Poribacteria bacterium]|nr:dihydrolipoamide acetyltransferase family protein [Candidatus Poribacteria bacterium]
MYQFKLPDLGEGIAEAEVVAWHVKEGDIVQADQLIAELMTDKAVMEIPSPKAGRVHRIGGEEGDIIPVGQILIEIDEGEAPEATSGVPSVEVEAVSTQTASTETAPIEEEVAAAQAASTDAPVERSAILDPRSAGTDSLSGLPTQESLAASEATDEKKHPPRMPSRPHAHPITATTERRKPVDAVPAVRELAKQLGVNIEQVSGTGPEGRIMRRDVEAFDEMMKTTAPVTAPVRLSSEATPSVADEPDWTRRPLRRLRRRIAERMVQSKTIIPHYTYVEEIDMTVIEDSRHAHAETAGAEKISPLAFIAHAVVRILARYPQMNACMDEQTEEIIYKGSIHLGLAVATEEGLVVPVIRDAAKRNVAELAAAIRDLSDRAHKKKLNLSELKGSTITITSLGKLGGVMATPIINYPASAIIGVHAIRTLPRYVGDQVQPRKIMNLSVSLDHRIVDGYECARFIQEVKPILEAGDFPEFK